MAALIDVLERLVLPDEAELPSEVARYVLGMHFSDADKTRYLSLAERHNDGKLSPEELSELEGFVEANTLLGIIKSKARLSLAKHQPAA
jgi:hypothetical protein